MLFFLFLKFEFFAVIERIFAWWSYYAVLSQNNCCYFLLHLIRYIFKYFIFNGKNGMYTFPFENLLLQSSNGTLLHLCRPEQSCLSQSQLEFLKLMFINYMIRDFPKFTLISEVNVIRCKFWCILHLF